MNKLRVTLVQTDLAWEQPEQNRASFSKKLEGLKNKTDVVVLPEMFTTGFSMNAQECSEPNDGPTLLWMKQEAKVLNAAVTGSVMIKESGLFYNRLYFVLPDGSYHTYDKKHTFTLAGEHKVHESGNKKLIVEYKGFRICTLICYDLRFPVWARNTDDYDVILYVANWPKKRINAWDALLKARAIENMAYCIGVNRIGTDGNGHPYVGHSAVYDVLGNLVSNSNWETDFVETIVLDKSHIQENRTQLQFLEDRDNFTII